MPNAAPHPCARPGCRIVVSRGARYCEEHEKAHRQVQDERRGTAYSRGYDRTWRKAREMYLAEHPLCVMCEAEGRVNAASVVDHIVSISDAPHLRLDTNNFRSLCKRHHDQRTAREQAWGRGGRKLQV